MKIILTARNKMLLALCALCVVFCAAMITWYCLLPVEDYELAVQTAQTQAQTAQTELDRRIEAAQTALTEETAVNEELELQLTQLQSDHAAKKEYEAALQADMDQIASLPDTILQVREEYGNKIRQLEEMITADETDLRICYLTLDDGPNNMTAKIIQRLDELEVYATFFTIGYNDAPNQEENLRAEMMGGHTIANHTYSHAYNGSLYRSFDEFTKQVLNQDAFVYEATGFHTDIFRFPSGSVACPWLEKAETWLLENGHQWIDWNANAYDAGLHALDDSSLQVKTRMMQSCEGLDMAVILCHDFNPATYGALKEFVPEMQELGYVFLPLLPQSHMFDAPLPVV